MDDFKTTMDYTPEQRAAALDQAEKEGLRATIDAQEKLRAGLMLYIEDAVQACGDEHVSGEPLAQAIRRMRDELAALRSQGSSVHGAASVITVANPPAATAPTAILIGSIPGVRQILSREDARHVLGRRDGDAVWDAFGRAPTPVFVAPVPEAPVPDLRLTLPSHKLGPEWVGATRDDVFGPVADSAPAARGPRPMTNAERAAALRADADRIERAEPAAGVAADNRDPGVNDPNHSVRCPSGCWCHKARSEAAIMRQGVRAILDSWCLEERLACLQLLLRGAQTTLRDPWPNRSTSRPAATVAEWGANERAAALEILRADVDLPAGSAHAAQPPTTHGTTIPPEALIADMLPCPFCGRADVLHVEPYPGGHSPAVRCRACLCIGPPPAPEGRTPRGATATWNRRATSAADLRLVPVFEGREGRERGDISDVVASCEASRLVTIKDFALIGEPPGVSVGFVVNAEQVKALRERVEEQRAIAQEPPLGARVRVTAGEHAGFVGTVQPSDADDPPGWSRVRRDLGARETRLFESRTGLRVSTLDLRIPARSSGRMIYLGTIANAGSDVVNNKTTSTTFAIPSGTIALRLQPSAGTLLAAVKLGDDATFLPADATTMLQLGAANSINDLPIHGAPMLPHTPTLVTLAVRKSDAGSSTCKVFAIGI